MKLWKDNEHIVKMGSETLLAKSIDAVEEAIIRASYFMNMNVLLKNPSRWNTWWCPAIT